MHDDNSKIVLMVQSAYVVFCYYSVSAVTIKSFEDTYGEGTWRNSKPALKVLKIEYDTASEIQNIFLDPFADNWYIYLKEDDMKVKVCLGRILDNGKFVTIADSNEVVTPREAEPPSEIQPINFDGSSGFKLVIKEEEY